MSEYDHNKNDLFDATGIDEDSRKLIIELEKRARNKLFHAFPKISISKFIEEVEKILNEYELDRKQSAILIGLLASNLIHITIDAVNKEKAKNPLYLNTKMKGEA